MSASRSSLRAESLWYLAGLAFLVGCTAFVGLQGYYFIDEAAVYGQLEVLERGDWTVERPFADLDPQAETLPMAKAYVVNDHYAPFVKHPVHVGVLGALDRVGGRAAVRALSTLGTLVAGLGAAALARPSGRRNAVAAFGVTVVLSPLLFQSQLVVGHAAAAGVAAVLTLVGLRRPPTYPNLVLLAALAGGGALIRSEFLLYAGALGVAMAIDALRTRVSVRDVVRPVAVWAGAGCAYLMEPWLVEIVAGGASSPFSIATSSRGGLDARLSSLVSALLEPSVAGDMQIEHAAVIVVAVASLAAAVLMRRRRLDRGPLILLSTVGISAGVVFALDPHVVPGLLFAFPAIAFVLMSAGKLGPTETNGLIAVGIFVALVALTQYEVVGGGVEWGWRYASLAMPALAPAVASGILRALDRGRAVGATPAVVALVIAVALVPIGGVVAQSESVGETDRFLESAEQAFRVSRADLALSVDASFGRFVYELGAHGKVVRVRDDASIRRVAGWAADEGLTRLLLVWRGNDPPEAELRSFGAVGPDRAIGGGYRVRVLELT